VLCPALDRCGGAVPAGDWVLNPTHPSCTEDLWIPPPDPRLIQADLPAARTPFPEPAHFDWCQLVGTGSGADIVKNQPPYFLVDSAPIGVATLHYDAATMTYALSTKRTGTFSLDFPSFCMRAFGALPTPEMNGVPAMNLCQRLQVSLNAGAALKYRNFACSLDPADPPGQEGCLCTFDYVDIQESSGRFIPSPEDGTILHLPGKDFPEKVGFCNGGDRLQLTGGDGEYLFDRVGLRTLDLAKATINCTDHMQGLGEDGVDCGAACPILCSQVNCGDAMQGPGEDGVDCGPNCPKTPVCPPAI
jgi:hypothetical protein